MPVGAVEAAVAIVAVVPLAWPFEAGSGSSGARPTTSAFRPGASSNRRAIQSAIAAPPSTRAALLTRKVLARAGRGRGGNHAREEQRPDPDRLFAAEWPSTISSPPSQVSSAYRLETQNSVGTSSSVVFLITCSSRSYSPVTFPTTSTNGSASRATGVEGISSQNRHADQDGDPGRRDVRERERAAVDRIPAVGRRAQIALRDRRVRRVTAPGRRS